MVLRGHWDQRSQSVVSGPAAAPGNVLETQILGPHPRPADSDTLGVQPTTWALMNPPGESDIHSSLRTTDLESTSTFVFILLWGN